MLKFDVISIFPEAFTSYLDTSLMNRARKKKIISVRIINPRDFTSDRHHSVDASPYGGGPGMVMRPEPIWRSVEYAKKGKKIKTHIVLFSLRGKPFTQVTAKRLAKYQKLLLICGRYEGVDERIAQTLADEEISLGDFVLSGGELPALVLIEAVSRNLPGFLGKEESREDIKGSYPVYTRPPVFEVAVRGKKKKLKVPEVLRGGNHAAIARWRKLHGKAP